MFDEEYAENDFLWGVKPSYLAKQVSNYKNEGKILDIGAGEGKDSVFFAKKGFDVTSLETSKKAIRKLEKRAKKEGLNVKTVNQKIEDFNFEEYYEVLISMNVLHFLPNNSTKEVIKKIKNNTSSDGLNVISVFNELNPNKNFPYLFKKDELKEFYEDWKILEYNEFETSYEKHGKNGNWHKHNLSQIIAKNPS